MERSNALLTGDTAAEVFISYHRGAVPDNAHRLAASLKERGCTVFIDDDIPAGTVLPGRIVEAIRGAIVGVPVITANYFDRFWTEKEIALLEINREDGRLEIIPALSGVSRDYVSNSSYADWVHRLYVDFAENYEAAVERIAAVIAQRRKRHREVNLRGLARAADGIADISPKAALEHTALPFVLPDAASLDQWSMAVAIAARHGRLHSLLDYVATTTLSRWDPRARLLLAPRSNPNVLLPERAWIAARVEEFRAAARDDTLIDALRLAALECVAPSLRARCGHELPASDVERALSKAQALGWVDAAGVFVDKAITFALAADALLEFGNAATIASAIVDVTRGDLGVISLAAQWNDPVALAIIAAVERDLATQSRDLPQGAVAPHIEMQSRRLRVLADAGRDVAALQDRIIEWATTAGRDDRIASILGQAGEQDIGVYARHAASHLTEPARRALVRAMVYLADSGVSLSSLTGKVGAVVRAARQAAQSQDTALAAADDGVLVLWCAVVGPDLNPAQRGLLNSVVARGDTSPRDARLVHEARLALERDGKS